eukprot:2324636-Rhodomonas_salina.3
MSLVSHSQSSGSGEHRCALSREVASYTSARRYPARGLYTRMFQRKGPWYASPLSAYAFAPLYPILTSRKVLSAYALAAPCPILT